MFPTEKYGAVLAHAAAKTLTPIHTYALWTITRHPLHIQALMKTLQQNCFYHASVADVEPGSRKDVPCWCSWAQVAGGPVHKMAMNVGRRPTVEAGNAEAALSVELHVLHDFPADFYGENMRAAVVGYLR